MKKILTIISICLFSVCLFAQNKQLPMASYINAESTTIPLQAQDYLLTKMNASIAKSGMGSTTDFTQFYLTCTYNVIDNHIVTSAPAKYFQKAELNFFVVDALGGKVFSSITIPVQGVGNSSAQAAIQSVKAFSPNDASMYKFLEGAKNKIINYYNNEYKNIIKTASIQAKAHNYEAALFQLSLVPNVCEGYNEVLAVAEGVYAKYVDDKANKALAKARSIWNATQNAEGAAHAGEYLATILPEASCYAQAEALNKEIKAKIKSDIDYLRKKEDIEHKENMALISAWRAVGVAYGNNQKPIYYTSKTLF